jgi:2-polyprenyl-6-methoxyphenol hydroxylase-like FAD-dependent oxidoreductase
MSRDRSGRRWRRCPAWLSGCGPAGGPRGWSAPAICPTSSAAPTGPGWALAGDAGYHRDPLTAQGISDAFRDAQLLSEAIDAGLAGRQPLAGALAGYQRRRDEAATAMYELTCQRAALEPPAPQMSQLLAALESNQDDTDRFFGVIAGTVPIADFFAPGNIQRITSAASTTA